MSRRRLDELFAAARSDGRTLFLPFMTAGLPDLDTSPALFEAMSGDGFEVGIPYSDPLMDGPTIQQAGQQAIAAGATFRRGLDVVSSVTGHRPALVMSYTNVAFRVGLDRFVGQVAEVGASAVILADLPLDEADDVLAALSQRDVGLVMFVAPTTPDQRIAAVAERDPVFIYAVADLGVTGRREETSQRAAPLGDRIRAITDAPVVFGVGISTPAQAAEVAPHADGVIVGSAIVRAVLDAPSPREAVEAAGRVSGAFAEAIAGS